MKKIVVIILIGICFAGKTAIGQKEYILNDSLNIQFKKVDSYQTEQLFLNEIKSESDLKLRFGKDLIKERIEIESSKGESWDEFTTEGLKLDISTNMKLSIEKFHIKSSKYILHAQNDIIVYVGMKLDELRKYFPETVNAIIDGKSRERQDNYVIYVPFGSLVNGNLILWDKRLVILIDKNSYKISEIYSFNPI